MPQLLFLTLNTYSRMGGIQQFNRAFCLGLNRLQATQGWHVKHLALADDALAKPNEQCQPPHTYQPFGYRRWSFSLAALRHWKRCQVVVLGHANLLPLAWLGTWLSKSTQVVLITHGYEAWQPLPWSGRLGLKKLAQCWCVSQYTASQVQQQWGLPAAKVQLLPNCLNPFFAAVQQADVSRLHQRLRIGRQRRYLLTLARLSSREHRKGYDAVLEILPRLKLQFPEICYVLAGKYDDKEYFRIQDRIAALGLTGSVAMPGYVPDADLPALYQMCEIFIMPSTKEGFGIVYIEAAWSGCQVIALNAGGASEALLQGQLGTLVPPDNSQLLLEAVQHALANPLQPQQKSAFKQMIQQHFGFDDFCHKQQALLEKLL